MAEVRQWWRGCGFSFSILPFLLVFSLLPPLHAEDRERALEPYVEEILEGEGAGSLSEIDPDQLPPEVLEELGFRVMDQIVADREWHRWMNEMMGGEGSQELAEFHRGLGESYVERGGELPEWRGRFGEPGMMRWHQQRWFVPPRMLIHPTVLPLLVIAGITSAVVVTGRSIRKRRRDE
ncbi:MAG: hypothetical protein ACOC45_03215 [Alkalispirochaetaceae bacterium]